MPAKITFTPETIVKALAAHDRGMSPAQIARTFGCTPSKLAGWVDRFSGLSAEEITEELIPLDNRYVQIMRRLFERHAPAGKVTTFEWDRTELNEISKELGIALPKNIGDAIYAMRHGRDELPDAVKALAPKGKHWLLLPNGKGKYRFVAANHFVLEHNQYLKVIKIPDSTPQIVAEYARGDEQAVLARVRYCRLLDIFLGLSAFPLQSHYRTTVAAFNGSQIETDDLSVGIDRHGAQYIIPVQAKGEDERVGAVQVIQDIYSCREKFPHLVVRAVAAKTIEVDKSGSGPPLYTIALLEIGVDKAYNVHVMREEHYQIVPSAMIDESDLQAYRKAAEVATGGKQG